MKHNMNKKLTIKYWNSLSEDSRRRALQHCFPTMKPVVEMLLAEKPEKDKRWWKIVFEKVRIPETDGLYKTVVNGTHLP